MGISDHHRSSQCRNFSREVPTYDEINRIIATANADPETLLTGAFVQVLFTTGICTGEFKNLKVSDIDEHTGVISIPSGTSLYGQRRIPLCLETREALHVLCAHRGDSEYVLGNSAAARVRYAAKQFGDIAKKLGIAQHPLHSLRRAFATSLTEAGLSLLVLQKVMGHSSIKTTERYYLRSNLNGPRR
jgi:integrase/recombinase XerD